MDQKGAAAIIGLGALGSILAYYGYNQFREDDMVLEQTNIKMSVDEMDITDKTITEPINEEVVEKISGHVKEEPVEKIVEKTSHKVMNVKNEKWGKFWEEEYRKIIPEKQRFPED
tara:strand:- start:1679 stop:2023 length:345 start_codon:yes stop_codon:yes gene_type:complete